MLYSFTHMATVGVKGLNVNRFSNYFTAETKIALSSKSYIVLLYNTSGSNINTSVW